MTINYELRMKRRALHMNIRKVSELTGVSKSTISNVENEVYPNTSYRTIKTLEEFYDKKIKEQHHNEIHKK